jgi:hypothetical protein
MSNPSYQSLKMSSNSSSYDLRSSYEDAAQNQTENEPFSGSKWRRDFNDKGFPWFGIIWRLGCSILFSFLVMDVLYVFSGWETLSTWDRRVFNALTIFLSSLVSLSVGSLLSLLGATLRWPILAWRHHTPREVDMILGMGYPSLAAKLVWHHCWRERKIKWTTVIIFVYLTVNIFGRLSIAMFGLTYNLNDNAVVDFPVMVPDFGNGAFLDTSWLSIAVDPRKISLIAMRKRKTEPYC